MLITGQDEILGEWVASRIGVNSFEQYTALGNTDEAGNLLGASVFNSYYPDRGIIEISAAGQDSRWLSRRMINAMFSYAFDQMKCQLVVIRVRETNTRMLNIAKRFGFSGYLIPRLHGRNEGEWILTFTEDQWLSSPYRR